MASDSLIKLQDSLWAILATLDTKECSVRELYGLVIRALRDSATAPDPPKLPTSPPIALNPKAAKAKPYRNQDGVPVDEELFDAIKEKMTNTVVNAPGTKTDEEIDKIFESEFAAAEKRVKDKAAGIAPPEKKPRGRKAAPKEAAAPAPAVPSAPKGRKRRDGNLVVAHVAHGGPRDTGGPTLVITPGKGNVVADEVLMVVA
jgi:hypothetical protein